MSLKFYGLRVTTSNGVHITTLNPLLVKQQNLDSLTIELLKQTHIMRYLLFQACEKTTDSVKLKRFAQMFETLEFYQQELWGFTRNRNFHYWFEIPNCTCSKDQYKSVVDDAPTFNRNYDVNCPIHGESHETH